MTKESIIIKCNCNHEFQDKQYGKGYRVYNHASAKGNRPNRYRCTVCGKEYEVGQTIKKQTG